MIAEDLSSIMMWRLGPEDGLLNIKKRAQFSCALFFMFSSLEGRA